MVATLTTLVIGFSIGSSAILLIAYLFFLPGMQKTRLGISACVVLLFALSGLQVGHLNFLRTGVELFETRTYAMLVLTTPAAFYFFSREILLPDSTWTPFQLAHLLPIGAGLLLPPAWVAPAAFVVGAGYTVWFARIVYGLRRHVARFRFEMFFFGLFALLALLILIMVMLIPQTGSSLFYVAYANFIGISMFLIVAALIVFPELLEDISDAAKLAYASSTLGGVDVEQKLADLERLMQDEKLFANENLNLALTAGALELSSHQLSELINTRFGHSFSRYIREQRVAEAKRLLREDQSASILSISMAAGFRSQSNFYTAFREITGVSPGAFRSRSPADET